MDSQEKNIWTTSSLNDTFSAPLTRSEMRLEKVHKTCNLWPPTEVPNARH